jgi:hypothetical protein
VQRREPMESGESQCVEKIFYMSRSPPEGGGGKVENRKIKNRKTRNPAFLPFAEKDEKGKKPKDRASLFDGYRRSQEGNPA